MDRHRMARSATCLPRRGSERNGSRARSDRRRGRSRSSVDRSLGESSSLRCHPGFETSFFRVDSSNDRRKGIRVAGGIRCVFGKRIFERGCRHLHRTAGRTSSQEILCRGIQGVSHEIGCRIRSALRGLVGLSRTPTGVPYLQSPSPVGSSRCSSPPANLHYPSGVNRRQRGFEELKNSHLANITSSSLSPVICFSPATSFRSVKKRNANAGTRTTRKLHQVIFPTMAL
jgi:hypothetical protein